MDFQTPDEFHQRQRQIGDGALFIAGRSCIEADDEPPVLDARFGVALLARRE